MVVVVDGMVVNDRETEVVLELLVELEAKVETTVLVIVYPEG